MYISTGIFNVWWGECGFHIRRTGLQTIWVKRVCCLGLSDITQIMENQTDNETEIATLWGLISTGYLRKISN